MAETVTQLIGPFVLDTARSGRLPKRTGNRDNTMAPQGVYPCRGEDEWIAISVLDDRRWSALAELVGLLAGVLAVPVRALTATLVPVLFNVSGGVVLATDTGEFEGTVFGVNIDTEGRDDRQ